MLPQTVIDEQNEDLDNLAFVLKDLGIKVHRPNLEYGSALTQSATWSGCNWHYHCPRDLTLVIGNKLIECPSPIWNRQFETYAYHHIFMEKFREGYEWIRAPMPLLTPNNYKEDTRGVPSLENEEILFEAANCVRCNDDILYQVSNTGNRLGGEWLQRTLGDKYKVHITEGLYSYAHLDSTIVPLREGLVMYNASRVTPENEPEMFKSWDKIWIESCHSNTTPPENLPWGASEWIGANLLSVSPELAVVDKHQTEIIEKLEKHGIDVLPLQLRHARIISGGFHCVTLDLARDNGY